MTIKTINEQAIQHLVEIARHHGIAVDGARLKNDFLVGEEPLTPVRFLRIAQSIGLEAQAQPLSWHRLGRLGQAYPAMVAFEEGQAFLLAGFGFDAEMGEDCVVVAHKVEAENRFELENLDQETFEKGGVGQLFLFRAAQKEAVNEGHFGLGWFVREAMKQKVLFAEIILVALVIHMTGLAVPLFFQITVDKVLVHESFQTLNVLMVAVIIILIFQGIFNFLRDYLLAFATSKIDMRTAARTFGHLVRLPLGFFHRSRAGVLTKHMQQTEEIREFLTGNVLETALDATALLVFLPLLFFYSVELGFIVLGFSLLIALVIAGMIRPFYKALERLYEAEGWRQSLLVETINGISTIKSLALEPRRRRVWDKSSASSVSTGFQVDKLGTFAESIVETLEQMMSVVILFVGAHMVFQGDLTVGKLIAFKMLSGNVSQPLVKIVQMIHEYQKARLAVKMLGEIMNEPTETVSETRTSRPAITGDIEFEDVKFFYDGSERTAPQDLTFKIDEGEIIGVVGESGSGKSTLARLIQGLYSSNAGRIRMNQVDIREIDLSHLRQTVGTVLQESLLFHGSVRENIALTVAGGTGIRLANIVEKRQIRGITAPLGKHWTKQAQVAS